MFIAALFLIAQNWKQPRHLPTVESLNHGTYIQETTYYSAITRNTLLIHSTMWMTLQRLILNEKKNMS